MKVRNIVRKAAVLGSSAALMGTTLMGALAYDLANYPDQFIVDGTFDGTIVVGERAATADVLGSIDIAASLQAASVTEEAVEIPGQAGEVMLEGDAFRIDAASDLLELRETVGEVYDTLTDSELDALGGGSITTDEGSTDYSQFLRFGDTAGSALQRIAVNFANDEDDVLGDFLVIDDDEPFFEWEIEFSEGLESGIASGELEDLEDEVFNIFGTPFTFVDSAISGNDVTLEFMAGQVADTLREGETRTYSIDGVDYEVTLVFVSDPNQGDAEAKFSVNGELTDGMQDGDTDKLSGGLQIGVRDLLVNSREGVVSFFLGADKVEFQDTNYADTTFVSSGVEIGDESIEDASLSIVGSNSSSTSAEITSIKYRLTADAKVGSTIYVPAGHGVREFLDEPEGMLSPTFDIQYHGLTDVTTYPVQVDSQSDHSYELVLTNIRGKTYDFPFVTNKDGTFFYGDDDDDLWFVEEAAPSVDDGSTYTLNLTNENGQFRIGDDDYFVLSENVIGSATEKDDSAVLRYEDIDTSDRILTFTDMASGETKTVSYQTTSAYGEAVGYASNFVVEGNSYSVWVGPAPDYNLSIALDGDDDIDGSEVGFTVRGGGVLDLSNTTPTVASGRARIASGGTGTILTMNLTTPATQFDGSAGRDALWWTVASAASNEVTLSVSGSNYFGPNAASANSPWGNFDIINDDADDDYDRGMTDYGALVEYYNPSGDDAEELTIHYPEQQRGAQVFVVAGSVEAGAASGSVTRQVVNPIAVGLAVLDKDAPAVGSENLIVVGGPCANSVAAALLGNPEQCGEGFEPGKAVIRAWDQGDTVAILVAGYEAAETQAASRVLANYGDYALSGDQVEVVGTDYSSLTVRSVE